MFEHWVFGIKGYSKPSEHYTVFKNYKIIPCSMVQMSVGLCYISSDRRTTRNFRGQGSNQGILKGFFTGVAFTKGYFR